jgi:hypothetical protein
VGKPEGKRPLGRLRCAYVDNVKKVLVEMEWDGMDWIDLILGRDKGSCECGNEPSGSIKC